MGELVSLLILFAVLGIVWYMLRWLAGELSIPEPVVKILTVVLVLVFVIAVLGLLLGVGPGVHWKFA